MRRVSGERSEELLHLNFQVNTEALPSLCSGPASPPQDDSVRGFSAACLARAFPSRHSACPKLFVKADGDLATFSRSHQRVGFTHAVECEPVRHQVRGVQIPADQTL